MRAKLRCWSFLIAIFILPLAWVSTASAQDQSSVDSPSQRVAKLSDAEVRALLLRELEEKVEQSEVGGASNPAFTSIQIQRQNSWLVGQLGTKLSAFGELPDGWQQAQEKLSAPREGRSFSALLFGILVSFGGGFPGRGYPISLVA